MSTSSVRTVVVTGTSRGLGLALVADLVAHGYRVASCSRTRTAELEKLMAAGNVFWQACNIGDAAEADAFFAAAETWAGSAGLWGLVNNAGIAGEGILATYPNVDIDRIIQTNLVGALQMARLAARHMLRRPGGGRIAVR